MQKQPRPSSAAINAYELIDDVCRAILQEPRRLNMNYWMALEIETGADPTYFAPSGLPACGTVACVAGWTVLMHPQNRVNPQDWNVAKTAKYILAGEHPTMWSALSNLFQLSGIGFDPGTIAYAEIVVGELRAFQTEYAEQLRNRRIESYSYEDVDHAYYNTFQRSY